MLDQIKVLNENEELSCVLSNVLPDACPIIEFRQIQEAQEGGAYSDTCSLTVPADNFDAQNYIYNGCYLLFQDSDGYWQEYKVVSWDKVDDASGSTIHATGEHAFYELLGEPLYDIRPTETTAAAAVIQALAGTRWTIGSADSLGDNSMRIYYTSVLAGLVQIATAWGGELYFHLDVVGGIITERKVDILAQRGSVTGKRFEYRKDMTSIKQTINMQTVFTALVGRGKGIEVDGGTETTDPTYGRRLDFSEVIWTIGGEGIDKPYGQKWVGDDVAAFTWGPGGRHIFGFVNFDECTDAEELLELTYAALQTYKEPQTTCEMSVLSLEEVTGYEHEAVRLGDTVNTISNAIRSCVSFGTARIIYRDKNLIDPKDCNVTLGNYIPSVHSNLVRIQKLQDAFDQRAGVWDRANAFSSTPPTGGGGLQVLIDLLTVQLASTVSGFHTDANGNFIFENPAQTKALFLGAGILAISNAKSGGEWVWRTFGTGDGFTADEVNAGTLRAGIVFAGELLAAHGTITSLIAGLTDAQRCTFGYSDLGQPYMSIYDSGNTLLWSNIAGEMTWGTDTVLKRFEIGNLRGLAVFIE